MADLAKIRFVNIGQLKARLKVASFLARLVSWMPIPMVKKLAAANWLLDWAMKPELKVEVD